MQIENKMKISYARTSPVCNYITYFVIPIRNWMWVFYKTLNMFDEKTVRVNKTLSIKITVLYCFKHWLNVTPITAAKYLKVYQQTH